MALGITDAARARVRARAEASMTARITISRGGSNAFDPVSGEVSGGAGASVVYAGKARIRTTTGAAVSLGNGMTDVITTMVSIPITGPLPQRDDLVTVIDSGPADPRLAQRTFRVLEVEGGSLIGDARRMTCSAYAPSRYWSPA